MATKRLKPTTRREQILDAAITLARRAYYTDVTRDAIAKELAVSPATIQYHFGTMKTLRRALVRHSIAGSDPENGRRKVYQKRCARVLAQALMAGDPHAEKAPAYLRSIAARVFQD